MIKKIFEAGDFYAILSDIVESNTIDPSLPRLFYLVKPKLLALTPSPPKVSKNCTPSRALVATTRLNMF